MKTISLTVSKEDYEAFREASNQGKGSIAQLIREAMRYYREKALREPLRELPVIVGPRPSDPPPPMPDRRRAR